MNVLVISAHPDDETLGCGGTLLKHRADGDRLHWLIVTKPQPPRWSKEQAEKKAGEVERVAQSYRVATCSRLELPAAMLDTLSLGDIIHKMQPVVEQAKPAVVYVVHHGDSHSDHRAVSAATTALLKSFYMARYGVRRLLAYETLSSTDAAAPATSTAFLPNVFNEITAHLEEKLDIMELYESEIQPDPQPRSLSAIRALARVRGATIGVEYAEAFMLLREIA